MRRRRRRDAYTLWALSLLLGSPAAWGLVMTPKPSSLAGEMWFEGPEKTLEICFTPGIGNPNGCRALKRRELASILAEARCSVLSSISNEHLDAYVLSESSLFVYPHRVVVKTCGQTTLLRCLGRLLELATFENTLGLRLEWVGYSRKNYFFPDDQRSPHKSFDEELSYLEERCQAARGDGYLLGPITGDHLFVYVSNSYRTHKTTTLNVMMFDLDEEVRRLFYLHKGENPDGEAGSRMMIRSGLNRLVDDTRHTVDNAAFEPCGYSMNAIRADSYSTVHVTPQAQCSYASFETNADGQSADLVRDILEIFKPQRAVVTLFSSREDDDDDALAGSLEVPGIGYYRRADLSSLRVQHDSFCVMANYALTPQKQPQSEKTTSSLSSSVEEDRREHKIETSSTSRPQFPAVIV